MPLSYHRTKSNGNANVERRRMKGGCDKGSLRAERRGEDCCICRGNSLLILPSWRTLFSITPSVQNFLFYDYSRYLILGVLLRKEARPGQLLALSHPPVSTLWKLLPLQWHESPRRQSCCFPHITVPLNSYITVSNYLTPGLWVLNCYSSG